MDRIIIDRKALFALASETRIEILKKLYKRRMTLTELSESLNMSKTTIKEHLDKLVEAELVRKVDEGRKWIYYDLTEKGEKILKPDTFTKIVLFISLSVASTFLGLFELYKVRSTQVPVPAPIQPSTFSEIHLFLSLILILSGVVLFLRFYLK